MPGAAGGVASDPKGFRDMRWQSLRGGLAAIIVGALAIFQAGPASAVMGGWVAGPNLQLRLLASADATGVVVAAVEIRLQPGWKTYWRTPGEGGLAPNFDFSRSFNLASAEVQYPAPHRLDDGYAVTNVYEGQVLFPLTLVPAVASAPMTVRLVLDLGVCEVICIPVRVEASIIVSPGRIDSAALRVIDEARAAIPGPPTAGFVITTVAVVGSSGRMIEFVATAILPQAFGAELFVEAPEGWLPLAVRQTAADGHQAVFGFTLQRPPEAEGVAGLPLRLTIVSAGAAIEQWVTLP